VKPVTIVVSALLQRAHVCVTADFSDPRVDLFTSVDDAEALVLACHPDYERVLRDVVAIEQERPKWWRDMRRIEELVAGGATPRGGGPDEEF